MLSSAKKRNNENSLMKKTGYYYLELINFYKFCIPAGSSILELTNQSFSYLDKLQPKKGLSINISAPRKNIFLRGKFEYIILPDLINQLPDIQKFIHQLKKVCTPETRLVLNYYNFLWSPILILAEILGIKRKQPQGNWLSDEDIVILLTLENFEIVNAKKRLLLSVYIPILSTLVNRYLANLPLINKLCLSNWVIARPLDFETNKKLNVSVIIPAKNERGNIENGVRKIPQMGKHTEIIFVEGHSNDQTNREIKRVIKKYKNLDIRLIKQTGFGKANAVRQGMTKAKGDILIIFDADLTVSTEELPKFYSAIVSGKGEFISGCRLVYPMEKQAMRTLNIFGNKFFSTIFTWMLGQKIKDTLCGTKVISLKNYQKIAANRKYFGEFDPFGDFDLIFGAAKLNLKFIEIPVKYKARLYGETNISRFKHGWMLLKMTAFALRKLKFI